MLLACLTGAGAAQTAGQTSASGKTRAQYAGGFNPRACRYPAEARKAGLSGCCQMDLEISAEGRVLKSSGTCSDPLFLEPTRRCLAMQEFEPATANGKPVKALQELEYEWRSTVPSKTNLCDKLKTS